MMLIDDLFHDRKAEPHAARLSRNVGLEDTRHQLLRETAAVVRHSKPHAIARKLGAHFDRRAYAIRRRRLESVLRILNQVVDDLADLRAVGPDWRQVAGETRGDRRV